jgi:hypothetical protein
MAATTPIVEGRSFEEFVGLHAERFTAYLRGMLGLQAEGRGGRVPVDDTLQDALLAIHSERIPVAATGAGMIVIVVTAAFAALGAWAGSFVGLVPVAAVSCSGSSEC